jgi:hypothetical protein
MYFQNPGLIIVYVVLCIGMFIWSAAWHRNAFAFLLLSAFFSPLLGAVILLIMGKGVDPSGKPQA